MMKGKTPLLGVCIWIVTWIGIFALMGCGASQVSESKFLEAAKNGTVEVIEQYEGDVLVMDSNGWMALHLAAYGGHVKIVELLLDRNADINRPTMEEYNGYYQVAPLHLAVSKGHIPVIELLIEREADVMAVDGYLRGADKFTEDMSIKRMIWARVSDVIMNRMDTDEDASL